MFIANLTPADVEIAPDWFVVLGLVLFGIWIMWDPIKKR